MTRARPYFCWISSALRPGSYPLRAVMWGGTRMPVVQVDIGRADLRVALLRRTHGVFAKRSQMRLVIGG